MFLFSHKFDWLHFLQQPIVRYIMYCTKTIDIAHCRNPCKSHCVTCTRYIHAPPIQTDSLRCCIFPNLLSAWWSASFVRWAPNLNSEFSSSSSSDLTGRVPCPSWEATPDCLPVYPSKGRVVSRRRLETSGTRKQINLECYRTESNSGHDFGHL